MGIPFSHTCSSTTLSMALPALQAILTSVRVVCQNTLNLALSGGGVKESLSGTGAIYRPGWKMPQTLGLVKKRLKAFSDEVGVFRSVEMANGRLQRYFDSLLAPLGNDPSDREGTNRLQARTGSTPISATS